MQPSLITEECAGQWKLVLVKCDRECELYSEGQYNLIGSLSSTFNNVCPWNQLQETKMWLTDIHLWLCCWQDTLKAQQKQHYNPPFTSQQVLIYTLLLLGSPYFLYQPSCVLPSLFFTSNIFYYHALSSVADLSLYFGAYNLIFILSIGGSDLLIVVIILSNSLIQHTPVTLWLCAFDSFTEPSWWYYHCTDVSRLQHDCLSWLWLPIACPPISPSSGTS
jgi:hypothetical protein